MSPADSDPAPSVDAGPRHGPPPTRAAARRPTARPFIGTPRSRCRRRQPWRRVAGMRGARRWVARPSGRPVARSRWIAGAPGGGAPPGRRHASVSVSPPAAVAPGRGVAVARGAGSPGHRVARSRGRVGSPGHLGARPSGRRSAESPSGRGAPPGRRHASDSVSPPIAVAPWRRVAGSRGAGSPGHRGARSRGSRWAAGVAGVAGVAGSPGSPRHRGIEAPGRGVTVRSSGHRRAVGSRGRGARGRCRATRARGRRDAGSSKRGRIGPAGPLSHAASWARRRCCRSQRTPRRGARAALRGEGRPMPSATTSASTRLTWADRRRPSSRGPP
ncbi:exodeoxyribonuclease V beta subunit [Jiangella alba]|uniref:Exodeoxyribonuclease V beta subunit n=1 Tax=Jiangella alba TaxID=561176 RepID=A0A1H5IB93_9ACTN|nr:exodeoxyribonuclease V beta subunit [Jiangella alba]